jgi:hypothetical protein
MSRRREFAQSLVQSTPDIGPNSRRSSDLPQSLTLGIGSTTTEKASRMVRCMARSRAVRWARRRRSSCGRRSATTRAWADSGRTSSNQQIPTRRTRGESFSSASLSPKWKVGWVRRTRRPPARLRSVKCEGVRLHLLAYANTLFRLHSCLCSRALQNVNQLLALVGLFPTVNQTSPDSPEGDPAAEASNEPDLSALLERIRARYKLTCSSLGVRPRLTAAKMTDADEEEGGGEALKGKVVVNGVGVSSKALLF